MCLEEAPVEMAHTDSFDNPAMFSQVKLLVESIYKKFPLIIIANLSKNSYQVLREENFINATIPTTGSYDEGYEKVRSLSFDEDMEELDKAFARGSLLDAHARGEKKVLRILSQKDEEGNIHRVAIEDYFMVNPSSDDVYIVAFFQRLDFNEKIYLNSVG